MRQTLCMFPGWVFDKPGSLSVRDRRSVDGSVNEHDFPVIAGFPEECCVHSDSFIYTVIDGVGESGPCGIAPGSRGNVVHAHLPLGRRGHLAIDEKQSERLTGQLVPVFVHPENIVGERSFEIADVALVVRIDAGLDEIDQRTWCWWRRAPASYGTSSRSGSLRESKTCGHRKRDGTDLNPSPHENLLMSCLEDHGRARK